MQDTVVQLQKEHWRGAWVMPNPWSGSQDRVKMTVISRFAQLQEHTDITADVFFPEAAPSPPVK